MGKKNKKILQKDYLIFFYEKKKIKKKKLIKTIENINKFVWHRHFQYGVRHSRKFTPFVSRSIFPNL